MGVQAMHKPPIEGIASDRSPELTLLSAIVNSSDDAIVGKTTDGIVTSWNKGAEHIYGYRAEEMIGQPIAVVCPAERVAEVREILDTIGRGERVEHFETERRRKDGTTFPASVTVSPIYDEGGALIGASSIARDVTEQQELRDVTEQRELRDIAELRHRAEELDRANQNLETFTFSVSHDLRAPLRAMSGFSDALQDEYGDALGEVGRGYAERIRAAGERMTLLIDDLLRLSRILRASVRPQPVDLGLEVTQIAEDLRREAPGRSVRFEIQRPVEALADRGLIRTVLENLVGNAWKFTSRQDDALIEFGTAPAPDAAVCCYVRDNGAGFDSAYAGKLFQPFQRLHSAGEFPGTGVGLTSVRQIVERHGGHVWAEGAVGQGATFYFTLNAKEVP
jgi:PAS domain S-box-containing protein